VIYAEELENLSDEVTILCFTLVDESSLSDQDQLVAEEMDETVGTGKNIDEFSALSNEAKIIEKGC
jgi:hypothetical protein